MHACLLLAQGVLQSCHSHILQLDLHTIMPTHTKTCVMVNCIVRTCVSHVASTTHTMPAGEAKVFPNTRRIGSHRI